MAYFSSVQLPFVNTMHAHTDDSRPITSSIVEVMTRVPFFHPNDRLGVIRTRALKIWERLEEPELSNRDFAGLDFK